NVDELVVLVGSIERRSPGPATKEISVRSANTCRRRIDIHVQSVEQDVRAPSSSISRGENDISRELTLNVQIELLHHPLFEVRVLRKRGSGKVIRVRRRGERLEAGLRQAVFQPAVYRTRTGSKIAKRARVDWTKGAGRAVGELVGFGVIRRILPESLRTLTPTRVVVDRVARANHRALAATRLPRQSNAWLDRRLVEVNSHVCIGANAVGATAERRISGDQILLRRPIEIRLTILRLRYWSHQGPCHAQIQGQVARDTPVVLHERTKHLPTAAGGRSVERLIVDRTVRLAYKQVGRCIAREPTANQEIAVLKSVGHDVHLIDTNSDASANVVMAANHVEGIAECVNVSTTHERSEPAIAQ